ncbi:MAG: Ig-like domain-containing protein [Lachnospiraceae bacterium]|nr:Ig-like domain-containing protein [Lachnospiraceae bacterium]
MCGTKKQKKSLKALKIFIFLLGFCLIMGMSTGVNLGIAYADETDNRKLQNGSFEDFNSSITWKDGYYAQPDQSLVSAWNTTATDGKIELLKTNTKYITGITLSPTEGSVAAELNAEQESTLYQTVSTTPSSIYEWGLDHGARNGTDTMALVIGPAQTVSPSKPSADGRDQFMQMIDWLIDQGETSVKTSAGLGEQLIVYSKKFAASGGFEDNADNNAFSLIPSTVYTEEWHIWIMADSKAASGMTENPWSKYGSNAEGSAIRTDESGNTAIDMSKYYLYTVPRDQEKTLFGFVSVGCDGSTVDVNKQKTYGNFLDNVNFRIYYPLSGSTTLHGSGVVGEESNTVTPEKKLMTYAVDGESIEVKAVVKSADAAAGCEFVGMYYTKQDASGNPQTVFFQKSEWTVTTNSEGDTVYTKNIDNLISATDLQFVFIKSPTVTYDANGGKPYTVERTYNTSEAANVYSFKPVADGENLTFISPYVSHAAEGQNDGWKFMGWLLTGDSGNTPVGISPVNAEQLGTLVLPATHTIACDYSTSGTAQDFKIWNGGVDQIANTSGNATKATWEPGGTSVVSYANAHKGLVLVAQWRWRQAFIPQLSSDSACVNSESGGTLEITSVTDASNPNYNATFNANGGKAYHATTNETVTVKATAATGYRFLGWYDNDGNLISTNETYSYTEVKEKVNTYYARFSGSVSRTLNGAGETMDLTDIITSGSAIISWVSGDPSIATVDGNGKVTAVGNGTCAITGTTAEGNTVICVITVNIPRNDSGNTQQGSSQNPTEFENPEQSEEPNQSENGSVTLESPKTGEDDALMLWAFLLLSTVAVLSGLFVGRHRILKK